MQENNLGKRTEYAKKAIIRYILESGLAEGEQLPPQAELRQKLKIGTVTIARALKDLEDDNIVEVRPQIGAFLKDPLVDGYKGWAIGITIQDFSRRPFESHLLLYLQKYLHDCGCQSLVFYGAETHQRTDFELEWFPGLRRCVESHRIDGLINTLEFSAEGWDFLRKHKLPMSFVGMLDLDVPCSTVGYDYAVFVKDAIGDLISKGFRHPALLTTCGVVKKLFQQAFSEAVCKLPRFEPEKYYFEGQPNPEAGKEAAGKLLQLSPEQRPDAIVCCDDNIAAGLVAGLIEQQWAIKEYQPQIIALCNRQIPLTLPWPSISYYENDVELLAKTCSDLCLGQIKDSASGAEVVRICPVKLVRDEAFGECCRV